MISGLDNANSALHYTPVPGQDHGSGASASMIKSKTCFRDSFPQY